jgi:aminoglycoside phosphotransferase (APT) family kinase protein
VPFPNDGWSGSSLTAIERGTERFIIKRTSAARDWIVRATRDIALREGVVAGGRLRLVEPLVAPYLGVASDGDSIAILMPDLSAELIAWNRPNHQPAVSEATLDRVLDAVARLHAMPWADYQAANPDWDWPWCPLPERLALLTRSSAERYRAEGLAVATPFLDGWEAFERRASAAARDLVERLDADPTPLLAAFGRLPRTGLHGDLKLANVALLGDGRIAMIDWQMMALAPVAVELGWLLVSNSASLPVEPDEVMRRYRRAADQTAAQALPLARPWLVESPSPIGPEMERITAPEVRLPPRGLEATVGDWDAQVDLTWIVGLVLRGWRKGLDAEAGTILASGVAAADDLAWWGARAVDAADRRL